MPVSTVLQTTIPSPHAASFVDGEAGLAVVNPSSSTAARTTFQLSRWFDLEGGVYTFKSYAKDAAQWYVGPTMNNARFMFAQVDAQGVVTYAAYMPPGRQRITIVLSNVQAAAANTLVAFSLARNGRVVYASVATGWVFDTTAVADVDVPQSGDPRLGLRVFNFRPNWASEVIERISFLTEVLTSESDMEQRRAMRRFPRRSFEASFLRTKRDRSRLQSFLTGIGKEQFLVPLWHEQWTLRESFSLTLDFPAGTAEAREFQPGTLAVLTDRDLTRHEIVRVDTLNVLLDRITMTRLQAPLAWPAGSRLTPLRVAKITDTTQIENPTDNVGLTTLRFDLIDPDTYLLPDWRYCVPLWQFPFNWATPVNLNFNRLSYDQDNETSRPESLNPGERTRISTRAGVTLRGRSNVYGFRQFITAARGRQVSFWFPTNLSDLQPLGDIEGAYFDVAKSGIGEFVSTPQDVHRMIMIRFKGDEQPPLFREVSNIENLLAVERVFVSLALPPVRLQDIEEVSFVLPVRFEQDAFELRHLVDDSRVVTTTVLTRSTEVGDLPPIECIVTSQPYPVENIESMSVGMTVLAVFESGVRIAPEAVDVGMTIGAVTFQELVFNLTTMADEALDVGMTMPAAVLTNIVFNLTTMADEALDVGMTIGSAVLDDVLLTYSNWPDEALDTGMTITAAELS